MSTSRFNKKEDFEGTHRSGCTGEVGRDVGRAVVEEDSRVDGHLRLDLASDGLTETCQLVGDGREQVSNRLVRALQHTNHGMSAAH